MINKLLKIKSQLLQQSLWLWPNLFSTITKIHKLKVTKTSKESVFFSLFPILVAPRIYGVWWGMGRPTESSELSMLSEVLLWMLAEKIVCRSVFKFNICLLAPVLPWGYLAGRNDVWENFFLGFISFGVLLGWGAARSWSLRRGLSFGWPGGVLSYLFRAFQEFAWGVLIS